MTALTYTIPPGARLCRCLGCNTHIYKKCGREIIAWPSEKTKT